MLKKHLKLITLGLLCLSLTITYWYEGNTKDNQLPTVTIDDNSNNYQQVYFLDTDDMLVPVSLNLPNPDNIISLVNDMVGKTTEGQVPNQKKHRGLIPEGTVVLNVELKDRILTVNFSEQFANYNKKDELRIVEGLVWMLTKPEGIDGIIIQMNGVTLDRMPVDGLPLNQPLTRAVGINNFETSSSRLYATIPVVVYYEKSHDDSSYFVPVTKRIETTTSSPVGLVSTILDQVSITSKVKQLESLSTLQLLSEPTLENGKLTINVNSSILEEEGVVYKHVYDALVLSLSDLQEVDTVSILVEGQSIKVSGYKEQEITVSNIIINQIEI